MSKGLRLALLTTLFLTSTSLAGPVYDNGAINTLDTATDSFVVKDSPAGAVTTLNVVRGGSADSGAVLGHSVLNIMGGSVRTVDTYDHSAMTVVGNGSSGPIPNSVLNVHDSSTATLNPFGHGGMDPLYLFSVNTFDDGKILAYGAETADVTLRGRSQFISPSPYGIQIHGQLYTYDDAVADFGQSPFVGGHNLTLAGNSRVYLRDGRPLAFLNVVVDDTSELHIRGTFNYPTGPVAAREGRILGRYAEGGFLQVDFVRNGDGQIILEAIPEPPAVVMAGLAGAALVIVSLRRKVR